MQNSILYLIALISMITLIIALEWDKIKKANKKQIIIILIILFFLGTALVPLFTY